MSDHSKVDLEPVARVSDALDAVVDETSQDMASLIQVQFVGCRTFTSDDAEDQWRGTGPLQIVSNRE